jgi:hypothetical protein
VHTSRGIDEVKSFGPDERGVDIRVDDEGRLWATFSGGTDDADLRIISGLRSVREVNLAGDSTVTDAGLAVVAGLPNLERLTVGSPNVTDAGIAHLAGATRLIALQLENCTGITDAGLDHLACLKNLQVLSLAGTRVTDAGVAKLHGAQKLRLVDLTRTAVSDGGATSLLQALPGVSIRR